MTIKLFSEFFGTFLLVLFGTGSIILGEEYTGLISNFGIALVFGTTVALLIVLFSKLSGAHFNPAVTLVVSLKKGIHLKLASLYIIVQCFGALLASLVLRLIFPLNQKLGATIPSGKWHYSFLIEVVITFTLILTILMVSKIKHLKIIYSACIIGLIVFIAAWLTGPISGASMNPARSIGPALISCHTEYLWVYILAPSFGAICAFLTEIFIFSHLKNNLK